MLLTTHTPLMQTQSLIGALSIGTYAFKPIRPIRTEKTRRLNVCMSMRGAQKATVSVPPPSPDTPTTPGILRPVSWTYAAGLVAITVAAISIGRQVLHSLGHSRGESSRGRSTPLSSLDEATIGSIAPLLLAAETAAGIDETATLSQDDLEKLEMNLRLLITTMDAQLGELQDTLADTLPEGSIEALEKITMELGEAEDRLTAVGPGGEGTAILETKLSELQWAEFGVLTAHASDEDKRMYRSMLYNRGVQTQLLRQVERQTLLRAQMADVSRQLEQLQAEGDSAASALLTSLDNNNTTTEQAHPAIVSLGIAGVAVPHPQKAATGGEDAFFINNIDGIFGVADGVGGWSVQGVDPSEYPRLLMEACSKSATRHADPLAVLKTAFQETHAPGSCTVALASLSEGFPAVLKVASLGDCGTRVVRNGRVIFATEIQQHKFNQPFQLASPKYYVGDAPSDAKRYTVAIQSGWSCFCG